MSGNRSLVRAGTVVGAAAVASRVLGFVRDVLMAQVLGTGAVADAFLVAFRIPNVVRRVLGEGGLNAGFVPLYGAMLTRDGQAAARAFAGRAIGDAALLLLALTAVAELLAGPLVFLFAAGFTEEGGKLALAAFYTRLALPFIAFTGLASLLAALLNAHRYFTAAAVAPALVNALLIVALLLADGDAAASPHAGADPQTGAWLAAAVSLSGLLHLAVVAWAVGRMPERPHLRRPARAGNAGGNGLGHLLRFALPALVASAMTQVILLAATALASAEPSAVSWLYYADRVFQLPLSFIGVAAGVVLLPEFVGGRDARRDVAPALTAFLTGALALALPAAAGLIALGPTVTAVLFERGAFTAADSRQTSALLMALATGLPAAAASKVLIQPFFASRRLATPFAAGIGGVAVTLAAARLTDIGTAASLGLWTQALALGIGARRDILWSRSFGVRIGGLTLAALAMGLMVATLDRLAAPWLAAEQPFVLRAGVLTGLCLAGIAAYAALAAPLGGIRELVRGKGAR